MDELTIDVDGAALVGSHSPGEGLVMVALHGSSEGTRDADLLRHLHEVLPARGIGVLTFDRRGEGASGGVPSVGDFERQALDCEAVLDALAGATVGLFGFSQGAWIAPIVASRRDDVACVVTVGACGVTPYEQMRYGVARHLEVAGYDAAVIGRVDGLWQTAYGAMRAGGPAVERAEGELRAASVEPWWPGAYLRSELPRGEDRAALLAQMGHDPLPSFRGVRCPVLAIYGEHDEWVPVALSVRAWQEAQGDNVETVVIEGAPHDPLRAGGVPAGEYERRLVEWLTDRAVIARR